MADELVDIVNKQDEVIQQTLKSEAHAKGLLHRCIIAEVINPKGEWAMVLQASDRQDAGQFVSPVGGHVQAEETELDALEREAFEEMGLTEFTHTFVGKAIFNREVRSRKENHYFILYEIYTSQIPKLNEESVDVKWFSLNELKKEYKQDRSKFGDAFHFVVDTFYSDLFK